MGFDRGMGRATTLLLFVVLLGGVFPAAAFAQIEQKPQTTEQKSQTADSQTIIARAEENFKRGEEAMSKGLPEIGRKMFDIAIDSVLQSGVDLKSDPKLDLYYRSLIERIHKFEAQPNDNHTQVDRTEISEPAVLDEITDEIKDDELAKT